MSADPLSGGAKCANPACNVAETGRCVEGLALDACPHYGKEAPQDIEGSSASEPPRTSVALRSASAFGSAETSATLRRTDARLIVIVGPSDSGKTSLIAGVYDLFQEGPIQSLNFAGSDTLHAFEHACHDARAASRRDVPHMSRTPRGEVRFFHLEVHDADRDKLATLLLADRAGEEYREVADDVGVVSDLVELYRADVVTFLVDGGRLLGPSRHNVRSEVVMMLQGLLEGRAFGPRCRIALVLTKLDAVMVSSSAEKVRSDFSLLAADVRRIYGADLGVIATFEIAASPKVGALARGTGVPELLQYWLEPSERGNSAERKSEAARLRGSRQFLAFRHVDEPLPND